MASLWRPSIGWHVTIDSVEIRSSSEMRSKYDRSIRICTKTACSILCGGRDHISHRCRCNKWVTSQVSAVDRYTFHCFPHCEGGSGQAESSLYGARPFLCPHKPSSRQNAKVSAGRSAAFFGQPFCPWLASTAAAPLYYLQSGPIFVVRTPK